MNKIDSFTFEHAGDTFVVDVIDGPKIFLLDGTPDPDSNGFSYTIPEGIFDTEDGFLAYSAAIQSYQEHRGS